MNKKILLQNINKIHTTILGAERIRNNLKLENNVDVIWFCKEMIVDNNSIIYKKGKNWYVICNNIIITINGFSYTIITAHEIKK